MVFRIRTISAACAIAATAWLASPAAAAERPSDKDVKALMERIHNERDRFEDQLDGNVKRSVLRGPNGEVNVEKYLDDLQENVNKMKDRFTSDYAAGAEVATVLQQASNIHRYMSNQTAAFDGASEWNRLSTSLGELATAYGTTLPMPDGQTPRRMNDKEVEKAAESLANSADSFGKALDGVLKADKTVDKTSRETALNAVKSFKDDAKKLGSTVGDGKPASGEARSLIERAGKVRAISAGRTLPAAVSTAWGSVESGLDKIAQAFFMSAR